MKSNSESELSGPIIQTSKDQIKQNKKRNQRGSTDDILYRQKILKQVIDSIEKKTGRPAARHDIINQMEKIGFGMSIASLYRDRTKLANQNTWVRDLMSEGTYSQHQQHSAGLLDFIEEQAMEQYSKTWTASKRVTRKNDDGITTEVTNTTELAAPKAQFLTILKDVVRLRNELTNGKNIKLSLALISEEFRKAKERAEVAERKNKELEAELKAVLKKGGTPATVPDH